MMSDLSVICLITCKLWRTLHNSYSNSWIHTDLNDNNNSTSVPSPSFPLACDRLEYNTDWFWLVGIIPLVGSMAHLNLFVVYIYIYTHRDVQYILLHKRSTGTLWRTELILYAVCLYRSIHTRVQYKPSDFSQLPPRTVMPAGLCSCAVNELLCF